ncbi:cytochrome c oxidase subunit II [Salinibacterium sp. SYSU T00001]|uniref:cytochrome c oxidase subunit II n=1 Tax=Homoserinimonas sedimenticola TaxID=2986805 RepID=UPI0022369601|nr:cytochrome c oxidase subunit II [Salinibacterium sedimenticola]MCW4384784.1 cytochrome c oxidase subunit II [Salinibacterium sedimenticola]
MRRGLGATIVGGLLIALAGCSREGQQSILNPQGERAEAVNGLWELMLWIGVIVWVIVSVVLVVALVRRRRAREERARNEGADPDADATANGRRAIWIVGIAGAIVPGLVIAGVTVASTLVTRDIDPAQAGETPTVEVIGHQYWWEVVYPEDDVVSANEIHIPVGERVRVEVTSDDVIHSFWVPELSGKMDMIPGRTNALWLHADEPGLYWGQCAEFCGLQHALMRIVVVAHEAEEYESWLEARQEPAEWTPGDEESEEVAFGREVFMSSSCVYCHTIEGTAANATIGPDLTHIASRETLAAGILPNTRGDLAGWILDPQSIKPGNKMPGTDLEGEELQALLTYLESLE